MTTSRDKLSKSETVIVAAIEDRVPLLVEAREVIAEFHAMIKRKSQVDLGTWLERARANLVVCQRRHERSGCCQRYGWSNGQTEGQITKLKLVKREM